MAEEGDIRNIDIQKRTSDNKMLEEADLMEMSQDQLIELFVERMIEDKGEEVTESQKEVLLTDLKDAVMTEILMNLPDYLVEKVNNSYEDGVISDELFDSVIEESGINTEEIAEKVMIRFRDGYLRHKMGEEE